MWIVKQGEEAALMATKEKKAAERSYDMDAAFDGDWGARLYISVAHFGSESY